MVQKEAVFSGGVIDISGIPRCFVVSSSDRPGRKASEYFSNAFPGTALIAEMVNENSWTFSMNETSIDCPSAIEFPFAHFPPQ